MCPYGASLRETGKRLSRFWRAAFISAGAIAVVASGVGPAIAQTATGPTVTMSVSTAGKVYGYNFVAFRDSYEHDKYAAATITGSVSNAAGGNVAQLYAQPFPYKHAPAAVAGQQLVLNGTSPQAYSFKTIPGIATRFSVEILPSATVSTPALATSASSTVYVATAQPDFYKYCTQKNRPICHITMRIYTILPASAYRAEARKRLYFYFAVKLSPDSEPKSPVWVNLDHSAKISKVKRISAFEFEQTVSFSFRVNNDGYAWAFNFCSKASESTDGVNLPGHHYCGNKRVKASWFLG
jgi:hypothetical protein